MHSNISRIIVLLISLIVFLVLLLPGSIPAKEAPPGKPVPVTVGIYLTDIYDVDIKKGTYTAHFYIWFLWSGKVNPRNFEVVNGHLVFKHEESTSLTAGMEYVSFRCRASLHGSFDLTEYPWDRQTLTVQIEDEDLEAAELVYLADADNSKVSANLNIGKRTLGTLRIAAAEYVYPTTFGNPARSAEKDTTYSRITVELPADHKGARIFVKTFLALFISVAVAFLTFIIRPCDLPPDSAWAYPACSAPWHP